MTFLDRAEQFLRVVGPLVSGDQPVKPVNGFRADSGSSDDDERPALPAAAVLLDGVPPEMLVRALPDAARSAATMLWRTSRWTLDTTLRAGNIVLQGTVTGQSADAIGVALLGEMRQSLLGAVGIGAWTTDGWGEPENTLADRMNALLDASAEVEHTEDAHPAFTRLLAELTPDEARILRLFAQRGPQPTVDVRTRKLMSGGSRLVTPALTMISRYAGCSNPARVPGYLDNMSRLGLIRFSDEALSDHRVYDVLEAQQEVKDALAQAGRGMTIRRSIELTVFGENLCAMTGLLPPPPSGALPAASSGNSGK